MFDTFLSVSMGKQHGSLARAGKVKGQTPKVPKNAEKKKQPRGRAKKRMLFNRRYSAKVKVGGPKQGPNKQAERK